MEFGLFISAKEIQKLEKCSEQNAKRLLAHIKAIFNKIGKKHRLTYHEYASFRMIDVTLVFQKLSDKESA
jgi:hypothetical protein